MKRIQTAVGVILFLAPGLSDAYSTKLHMISGYHLAEMMRRSPNGCSVTVGGWANNPSLAATVPGRAATLGRTQRTIDLSGEVCQLITNPATLQYFVSGTTGPDTFPGLFGNTDPTHALLWNTAWQIPVLWHNAKTPEEKAFVLGWVVHFAGDLNAHGLANMHANGVWLAGGDVNTAWRHVVSEVFYAKDMLPYPPGFDNRLVWPEAFVKKMFFNPESPLYKHFDYLWNRYFKADHVGYVAKTFGGLFRTLFLLYDFHAREVNIWEGRKDFYTPRRDQSTDDFIHLAFADQAWNWHKKKGAEVRMVLDRWYTATHRAQQAAVADPAAQFSGKTASGTAFEYDDPDPNPRSSKRHRYASAGVAGILGAYRYFADGLSYYLSPQLITITPDNFPILYDVIQRMHGLGEDARIVVDAIQQSIDAFVAVLTKPVSLLANAIKDIFDPVFEEFAEYLRDDLLCNRTGMQPMCDTIRAQRSAFGVTPQNLATYLNWPIYANTITVAGLSLEKMKTMNRVSGDETDSPFFGLPSGDFGCTLSCTKIHRDNVDLFMPTAGKYYTNAAVSSALPDYCVESVDPGVRRAIPLNQTFAGKTNNQVNVTDATQFPAFTCFDAARGATRSPACEPADSYAAPAPGPVPATVPVAQRPVDLVPSLLGNLYNLIRGRWSHNAQTLPRTPDKLVMPVDAYDFQARRPVTYLRDGAATTETGAVRAVCYQPLAYREGSSGGATTTAPSMPDPIADHRNLKVAAAFALPDLAQGALAPIAKLLRVSPNALASQWRQVCSQTSRAARATWQRLIGNPSCSSVAGVCEARSLRQVGVAECANTVCIEVLGLMFQIDQEKVKQCYESSCNVSVALSEWSCK